VKLRHYLSLQLGKWRTTGASLTTDELQELLENRDSSNTKNVIGAAKPIFLDYWRAKSINSEERLQQSKEEIACFFIISMRK